MRVRALALVGVLALGACGDSGDDRLGAPLPDVTLPSLIADGEPLALSSLAGPAVVNLWATWCEPCRAELPAFQQASVEHPAVRFVGVDIGEEPAEAMAFLDEIGVDTDVFGQYGDPEAELTDALEVSNLPVTILVDPEGRIAEIHLGPMTTDDLDDAIDGL